MIRHPYANGALLLVANPVGKDDPGANDQSQSARPMPSSQFGRRAPDLRHASGLVEAGGEEPDGLVRRPALEIEQSHYGVEIGGIYSHPIDGVCRETHDEARPDRPYGLGELVGAHGFTATT